MNQRVVAALVAALVAVIQISAQQVRLDGMPSRREIGKLAVERPVVVDLQLPGVDGSPRRVTMQRMAVTLPWSKCQVMTDEGMIETPLAEQITVYRTRLGDPGSDWTVVAIDRSGSITGMTQQDGKRYVIVRDTSNEHHMVIQAESSRARTCATQSDRISSAAMSALRQAGRKTYEAPNANDTLTLELAVEVDNDFVKEAGSVNEARLLIAMNFAAVSTVYEIDLRTKVVISNLRQWQTANDPYPSRTSIFDLLDIFIELYQITMSTVHRDVAVFVTARGEEGGLAKTIGGLCETDGSYCAVDCTPSFVDYPAWSWNVLAIAHEIGHVCGAIHTHSCYWPNGSLDSCWYPESGTCYSEMQMRPAIGTIMSYCDLIKYARRGALQFHPMHRLVMREFLQSRPCVGNSAPARICTLRGVVRDAFTGEPLSGVPLKIRPHIDDLYRGTSVPVDDSVVVSAADGTWMFTGLARGTYAMDIEGPYITHPVMDTDDSFSFGIVIADSVQFKEVLLTKAQYVDITIENGGDTTSTILNIFNARLPGLREDVEVPLPERTQTSVTVRRLLPIGRTVIVPSAVGRRFTPTSLRIDVGGDAPQTAPTLVSSSVLPELTVTIAIAVVEVNRMSTPRQRFAANVPYDVSSASTLTRYRGLTDEDGVAVIENVDAGKLWNLRAQADTATKAPASDIGIVIPRYNWMSSVVYIQPRRFPLLARQYRFRAQAGVYRPLVSPTVLQDTRARTQNILPVVLPFSIPVLDRKLDTMYVHQGGYISFGGEGFRDYLVYPMSALDNADLVIAPLASDVMSLDSTAPNGAQIVWAVEGTPPHRTVVVEWRNMELVSYDAPNGRRYTAGVASFQARVSEDGNIAMVYHPEVLLSMPVNVQIGIRGNDALDQQVVLPSTDPASSSDILKSYAAFTYRGTEKISLTQSRQPLSGTTFHWELTTTDVADQASSSEVRLDPNPSADHITIRHVDVDAVVRVLSLQGVELMRVTSASRDAQIDVSTLPQGAYTALISSSRGQTRVPFMVVR